MNNHSAEACFQKAGGRNSRDSSRETAKQAKAKRQQTPGRRSRKDRSKSYSKELKALSKKKKKILAKWAKSRAPMSSETEYETEYSYSDSELDDPNHCKKANRVKLSNSINHRVLREDTSDEEEMFQTSRIHC